MKAQTPSIGTRLLRWRWASRQPSLPRWRRALVACRSPEEDAFGVQGNQQAVKVAVASFPNPVHEQKPVTPAFHCENHVTPLFVSGCAGMPAVGLPLGQQRHEMAPSSPCALYIGHPTKDNDAVLLWIRHCKSRVSEKSSWQGHHLRRELGRQRCDPHFQLWAQQCPIIVAPPDWRLALGLGPFVCGIFTGSGKAGPQQLDAFFVRSQSTHRQQLSFQRVEHLFLGSPLGSSWSKLRHGFPGFGAKS